MTYAPENKAVPQPGLLAPGAGTDLAFAGAGFSHLTAYLKGVAGLPATLPDAPAELAEAIGALRSLATTFGSPAGLRAALVKAPDFLQAATAPEGAYAGLVWLVSRLHQDAETLASGLSTLAGGDGGPSDAAGVAEVLRDLATRGAAAMLLGAPLRARFQELVPAITAGNEALTGAASKAAAALQDLQVEVGRRQQQVKAAEAAIAGRSVFTSKTTKERQQRDLDEAKAALASTSARAERLRGVIARIEPVLAEGPWLASAIDDLTAFLDAHRKVWMGLSSGLTEVASNAKPAQLGDPAWLASALGTAEARRRWGAIDAAAKAFAIQALVDW